MPNDMFFYACIIGFGWVICGTIANNDVRWTFGGIALMAGSYLVTRSSGIAAFDVLLVLGTISFAFLPEFKSMGCFGSRKTDKQNRP